MDIAKIIFFIVIISMGLIGPAFCMTSESVSIKRPPFFNDSYKKLVINSDEALDAFIKNPMPQFVIVIENCSLESIPDEIADNCFTLVIWYCHRFSRITQRVFAGTLWIEGCPAFEHLGNLQGSDTLVVFNCPNFRSIGLLCSVASLLYVQKCPLEIWKRDGFFKSVANAGPITICYK